MRIKSEFFLLHLHLPFVKMSVGGLVFVFMLCAVANVWGYSPEILSFLAGVHEKCKAESGASDESINSSANGGKMAEDYAYKCYLKCTMIELETMNSEGIVDVEHAVSKLPQELIDAGVDNMIRTCGTKKGADDCETGFLTLQCYQQTFPDVRYFVAFGILQLTYFLWGL